MTLDETSRFRITTKLVGPLGEQDAAKLMDAIPPIDWNRFATKDDITAATILTKAEMELEFANFRTEVSAEFANVRLEMNTEFADVRDEMRTEFASVRSEMKTEFANVRGEMKTEFASVRSEMQTEFADVRDEMRTDSASIRLDIANLRAEMYKSFRSNTFATITYMTGINAAMFSLFTWLR